MNRLALRRPEPSVTARRLAWTALGAAFLCLASPVEAASLQQVSGWSVAGLPSDVTMYAYVPDQVASPSPVLALIHSCGGTAQAAFGQAQGGGLVKAADQYGFILVVPSSGRCWDIVSDNTDSGCSYSSSTALSAPWGWMLAALRRGRKQQVTGRASTRRLS